jgi:hypothetical protein
VADVEAVDDGRSAQRVSMASPPPPSESKAFARRFRAAVAESSDTVAEAARACSAPVISRARRNPMPRHATLVDADRLWRKVMPAQFRLDLTSSITKRGPALQLREVRVVGGQTEWEGALRDGVAISLFELRAEPGRTSLAITPIASVQEHAIARWHQRSFQPTIEALLRDLAALAKGYASALAHAERTGAREFAVSAGDGRWVGELTWQHAPDMRQESVMLWTRTFLNNDE